MSQNIIKLIKYSLQFLYVVPKFHRGRLPIRDKVERKRKLRVRSPQADYTDRATAAFRRSWCQPLRVEGVAWSAQRISTAVNLVFFRPEPLVFHSSSSSVVLTWLSGPRSTSPIFQKIW
jgi:hypothetical protein